MEVTPQGTEQKEVQSEPKNKNKGLLIVSSVHGVVTVALAVTLFTSFQQVKGLEKEVSSLKTDNITMKQEVSDVKGLSETVDLVRLNGFKNTVQHAMETSVVTDQLVVNRVGILEKSILIDVDTQPPTALKYKGYGKFDMQDREIKGMVTDLLNKTEEGYNNLLKLYSGKIPMPNWEKTPITVTIKNYEVGTFKDGKFTLKGETN